MNSVVDPFLLQHIANIILIKNIGNIDFADTSMRYIKGFGVMTLILEKITGISLQKIPFYVITGPIFLINYFTLAREFTKSKVNSLLLMIIPAFGFATSYYSIWPHGFGFSLYLLFIYLYCKILSDIVLIKKANYVVLLLIIFAATNFYSYTAEVWMIIFSIFINFLIVFYSYIYREDLKSYLTKDMLMVFIALFLMFNNIAFNSYLPKIKFSAMYDSVSYFLHPFSNFLGYAGSETHKYAYYTESPKLLTFINISILILLMLPIFISIFFDFKKLFDKESNTNLNKIFMIKYSLIIVGISDVILYALLGVLFLRYILFIFPILAVVSLTHLLKNQQKFISLFICCIVILSTISFCWTWSLGLKNTSESKFEEFNYGANWIYNNDVDVQILSDHYSVSWYQIIFAEKGSKLKGSYYSEESFYHLADPSFTGYKDGYFNKDYVVINQKFKKNKTWVGGWNDFISIITCENIIECNLNLNKIYNDQIVSIFKGF